MAIAVRLLDSTLTVLFSLLVKSFGNRPKLYVVENLLNGFANLLSAGLTPWRALAFAFAIFRLASFLGSRGNNFSPLASKVIHTLEVELGNEHLVLSPDRS